MKNILFALLLPLCAFANEQMPYEITDILAGNFPSSETCSIHFNVGDEIPVHFPQMEGDLLFFEGAKEPVGVLKVLQEFSLFIDSAHAHFSSDLQGTVSLYLQMQTEEGKKQLSLTLGCEVGETEGAATALNAEELNFSIDEGESIPLVLEVQGNLLAFEPLTSEARNIHFLKTLHVATDLQDQQIKFSRDGLKWLPFEEMFIIECALDESGADFPVKFIVNIREDLSSELADGEKAE